MTIEIDDAGTGDLLGSAWIVFWRRETNDLLKKEIPLEIYESPDFLPLARQKCRELFEQAFTELGVPKTEDIYLCTGNIFDDAREFLKNENYNFYDAKIEGYLQEVVEEVYLDSIIREFDFPKEKASTKSGKDRFFSQYHWISHDFPRRQYYVKSGFEKWGTKWKGDAEEEWMTRMVKIDDRIRKDDSHHRKPRKMYVKKTGKRSQGKASRSSPQSKHVKHSKSSRPSKGSKKRNSKRRNPRSSRPPHSNDKKYSSTDPDRKNFLF